MSCLHWRSVDSLGYLALLPNSADPLNSGTSVRDDMKALQDGPHVVVGTPGRVQDMIQR